MTLIDPKQIENKLKELTKTKKQETLDKLNAIIAIMPDSLSNLINNAFKYKRIPKEYLLSSILFTFSTAIGRTFFIEALGYKNYTNLYFAIIGSRGDVKSEAIKTATNPLKKCDDKDYEQYLFDNKHLAKEEELIKRKQVLIQNASIEAAYQIHFENPNSIGICMDEIFGLVEKMGNSNSRDGVYWREFLLEGYTNGVVDVSRKTTTSFRINETHPTLIGGLQNQFVKNLFANGNLESGFIDRLLFTTKLTENRKLMSQGIPDGILDEYNLSIKNLLEYKKQSEHPEERLKQFQIHFTKEAENKLFKYVQKLINDQEDAKPIIKEYLAKMQISIHKLCLLSYMMLNANEKTFRAQLTIESVELAVVLNDFYYLNFQIIIEDNINTKEKKVSTEEIIAVAKKNKASQKSVSEVTGLNKSTISRKWETS
jgi:hypothetical protein